MRRSAMAFITVLALTGSLPLMAQRGERAKPTQGADGDAKPATVAPSAPATDVINLNTATAVQIATLPGIGPKTADLIVQYRQKNGSFKKVEEILESSRSCPYLLSISRLSAHRSVSGNR